MKQRLYVILLFILTSSIGSTAWPDENSRNEPTPSPLSSPVKGEEPNGTLKQSAADRSIEASSGIPEGSYRIGSGDVLLVSVWKNEDLTKEIVVLPDGTISFPLIGKVEAEGRTLDELKGDLETKLKAYINDPVISISMKTVNSLNVYVIGRVNIPGRFALYSNIDVLQALALAGGPNAYADRKNIRIFRKDKGKTVSIKFNYKEVTEGVHLEQNIMLQRGDVIVVP